MVIELSLCGSCEGRGCDDCDNGQICAWCGDAASAIGAECSCCSHGVPPHMQLKSGCPDCEREEMERAHFFLKGAA